MITFLLSVLTFTAVFLGIFAINLILTDVFKKERQKQQQELQDDLRFKVRERAKDSMEQSFDGLAEFSNDRGAGYFSIVDFVKQFREMTTQAGMNLDIARIFTTASIASLVLAGCFLLVFRNPAVAVMIFTVGSFSPIFYVALKRKQRQEKLCEQLPDALDLMSRVLRAGQTTTQGMNAISEEFKPPVGEEFGYCYEQQNLGLSTDVALRQLARRTGVMEMKIFVMAVLIQRKSGGNLAELLDKLANVIRKRFEIKGLIRGLTAEGRLQAIILTLLPFLVWILLLIFNRTYALKLLDHPMLIISSLVGMTIGALWIRKIVNFDF